MNESEEVVTILIELDHESLFALLDCVNFRLETWPDSDYEEQENLEALKSMLFAGGLEFQFDD